MKAKSTQSRGGVKGGTSSLFISPLQGQGTASLVGFGATPQLFLVKPTQRKKTSKVAAAKRPAPKLCASSDAPPSCSIHHLCCVAPDGRDHDAGLATIAALSRKQGFRLCGGEEGALRSPPTPLRSAHPCGLTFAAAGENRAPDRSPRALWGAKSVLLMQSLAVLRRKERQLDVFDAFLHPMRLAKQGNMM